MKPLKLLTCLAGLALVAGAQTPRSLCLFFDLNSLSAPDQLRARDAAIKFVQEQMTASDAISIMTSTSDVNVVQDFSSDRDILIAALRRIGSNTAPGAADGRLQAIQRASAILAGVPGKKALIYFSTGSSQTGADDRDQLKATVNAAISANVAIYSVDAGQLGNVVVPLR